MTGVTITDFIAANLARIEQDRCNRVEITNDPVTVGGRLVQYVGMSVDYRGTYLRVADLDADRRLLPDPRYLTPEEAAEFRAQCPPSEGAIEARCWVAAIRAVVAAHPMQRVQIEWDEPGDQACRADDENWPCPTIRAIAGIWADRDGWQEAWR